MHPDIGDIWMDNEDGYCVLFLSEPNYSEQHIWATVLILMTGEIKTRSFPLDDETGGLCEWWTKVA